MIRAASPLLATLFTIVARQCPTLAALAATTALLGIVPQGCGSKDVLERIYASPDAGPPRRESPFTVTIHRPRALEAISTNERDAMGRAVEVRCETCHSTQTFRLPETAATLGGPHAGLRFEHGSNRCNSCHDPARFDRLHLATGESIPMTEAMQICEQCHGPQARDYRFGAHGGMNGYWDLHRGPRVRNHCVDCHDPHAPAFVRFYPAPPPRDLPPAHSGATHD